MLHPHSGLLHGQAHRQHRGTDRFMCARYCTMKPGRLLLNKLGHGTVSYSSLGKRQVSAICTDVHHTGPPSGRGWCLWYRQSSGQSFAFPRSTKASHPSWTRHQKKHSEGVVVGLDVHMNLLLAFSKGEGWVRNWPR